MERQLSLVLILFAAGLAFPQAGFLYSLIRFLNNRMIFMGSHDRLIPCLQKAVEPGPVSYK